MSLLRLENIGKTYQKGKAAEVHALRGIDLEFEEGEFAMIMGSSGSGKSTLMNVIGCLDRPTTGSYRIDGEEAGGLSRDARADIRGRKIGFVFQDFNLLARTSALENVELPLLYNRNPPSRREMRERALEALCVVGLENRSHHTPCELSGGQQQRVAIARALVNRPRLLLADEPTGNLDSQTTLDVLALLQRFNEEEKLTIVMVTHEPEIRCYARRVLQMKDGRLASDERVRDRRNARSDAEALKREAAEKDEAGEEAP